MSGYPPSKQLDSADQRLAQQNLPDHQNQQPLNPQNVQQNHQNIQHLEPPQIPPPQLVYDQFHLYYASVQQLPASPAYYHPSAMLRASLVGRPVLPMNNMNPSVSATDNFMAANPQPPQPLPPESNYPNFRQSYPVYGNVHAAHKETPPISQKSLAQDDLRTDSETPVKIELLGKVAHRKTAYSRKRSLTACDTCRQKKSKCDNVRPRCGACTHAGNANCRYRADDPASDLLAYDPASLNILLKLDQILDELKVTQPAKKQKIQKRPHFFQHCQWDMSVTLMLRWTYLHKVLGTTPDEVARQTRRLVRNYEDVNVALDLPRSFQERFVACSALERLLYSEFSTFCNSFFVNCHTKVPCLDRVTLLESVEVYTVMKRADPSLSFTSMLEEFVELGENEVPQSYVNSIAKFNIQDSAVRRRAYRHCCESIPVLLVICAIGALSTPIRLDNLEVFSSSLEERSSLDFCCTDLQGAEHIIPRDRIKLSNMFITYAVFISTTFPTSLKPNSLVAVEYHILLSQYNMYIMNPLKAHREIVLASTEMMYFLEKEKLRADDSDGLPDYALNDKRSVVDRLFWTCLKLECEFRAELSPYVPLSGITLMAPPSLFLKIPEPLLEDDHLSECIKLSNRFDDNNSWFFFLTEIAVRKVDNKLFDEIYSAEGSKNMMWDRPDFAERTAWSVLIKYLNQYNGIISALSPRIRNFVLLEVNVEQIYASMKRRADKKNQRGDIEENIFDNLDDFLIDDDLLLRAQSESIMFIKTRILVSKLALFRPLIYLILEDKIPLLEVVEAAASVLPSLQISQSEQTILHDQPDSPLQSKSSSSTNNDSSQVESSHSSSNFATNFIDGEMSYFDITNAPFFYQKRYPDDDFSDLIEYTDGCDEFDENFIHIKDFPAARKRLLRVLVRNMITLPKLNIPKIGLHRHAGSWYYLRNLFFGVILQFLLFKKVQEAIMNMMRSNSLPGDPQQGGEIMEALNLVFSRVTVAASLEHALLILNYWKAERKDCEVYAEYIQMCLDKL